MKFHLSCRPFLLQLEEFLDQHPGPLPSLPPGEWGHHSRHCSACLERWRTAARSRILLAGLQAPPAAPDPYFFQRLQTRLAPQPRPWLGGLRISWRSLTLAGTLFAVTATSFAYDLHRTETPNADEAMVLDVPHVNAMHPSDDHVRPTLSDAMLNLMNP